MSVFPAQSSVSFFMLNKNRGKVISSMANPENDQRLQNITLSRVPVPDKTIACQTLLRQDVSYKGWLRRKKPGKLTAALGSLLPSIMWDQMFVVICKGCLYFYIIESDKKPAKSLSLFGYTRVMRANELQCKQNGLWPFKVAYVLDEHDRVHYLSAACEEDMMKWMKAIKLELYKANGVEYSDDSITDEDIHDLETPISTGNYFRQIEGLNQIKKVVEDDSDMDSDYDYIDSDDQPTKPQLPVLPSAQKTKVKSLPTKPLRTSPTSKEYYPPFTLIQDDSPPISSTITKPLPATPPGGKKPQPTPPVQPNKLLSKAKGPPVKPKLKLSTDFGESESRDTPTKTPSGESIPFVSVADLQRAIGGIVAKKPAVAGKTSVQPSKSPGHFALAETQSSPSVTTFKSLPPVPGQARESNSVPMAVVAPRRQSPNSGQNRFSEDLEASALWMYDAGEGQRLLMSLGREGAYMLRCCSDGSQALTLLVIADCQLRKYKVFVDEIGMLSLQTDFLPSFDSIHNMLNYYRTNFLPNRQTKLSQTYSELQRR